MQMTPEKSYQYCSYICLYTIVFRFQRERERERLREKMNLVLKISENYSDDKKRLKNNKRK